ncbi:MAG: hypothetical protein U9Q05_01700 [Thermodesulfobacteriota bacterium]|nr:hypothetical protein [Thermodesulfobacteriota bacterium]
MGRDAKAIQKALDAVAEEQKIEVLPAGSRVVQEPLENGVSSVPLLVRVHMTISR